MKMSVIITAHNAGDTIQACVESALLACTRVTAPTEVVIVFDEIAEDVTDQVHRLLHLSPSLHLATPGRLGRGAALNYAASIARGQLLSILDADDIMMPNRLVLQHSFLLSRPDIQATGGQSLQFGSWGIKKNRHEWPVSREDIDARLARGRMPFAHPTVTMRREWFEKVGGYDNRAVKAQDFDLFLRGWLPGIYESLPDVLVEYRTSGRFPSFNYWMLEEAYRRAIVTRHMSANPSQPLNPTMGNNAMTRTADAMRWAAQRTFTSVRDTLKADPTGRRGRGGLAS